MREQAMSHRAVFAKGGLLLGLPVALGLLAAGCSSSRVLELAPSDRVPLELGEPQRVAVLPPTDARPRVEREGRTPKVIDRSVPFVGGVNIERGSDVSSDGDLGGDPLAALGATLRGYVGSIDGVTTSDDVTGAGGEDAVSGADYVLETEVLHLEAGAYRARRELKAPVIGWIVNPDLEERYLPTANVVLRLRLRSADGRFQAARVVNASVLGGPDDADEPGALVAGATRAAAHEARQLTASWLARAEAGARTAGLPVAGRSASAPSTTGDAQGTSFLVHAVDVNRLGVVLARIDRETGDVVWIERREGLPLIGPPGVWHLAPFDEHGVLLPPAEYDALSRELAERFVLQRIDQLTVYRYLGPLGR